MLDPQRQSSSITRRHATRGLDLAALLGHLERMGRWLGVEVLGTTLCGLAFGGCWQTERRVVCETDYYVDPGTMQERPLDDCDGSSDPGYDYGAPCDGIEKSLGRVVELTQGTAELVDVFVADSGIIVVTRNRVSLFDRNGARLATRTFDDPEIDTAAFDGSILVVNGAYQLVSYDTRLNELGRRALGVLCASSVLVGGPRFVCGDPSEDDRAYSTYDALTGARQSTSEPIYEQGPMRRVTGRDAFITVNPHVTPRSFVLFGVDEMGSVQATAGTWGQVSPEYSIGLTYAFAENPAEHLITDRGQLVCLTPEDCNDPALGDFQLEGSIGSLADELYFGAMDVDDAGKLHAVVGPLTGWLAGNPTCENGCTLQRIDIASGSIEASAEFALETPSFLMLVRADPQGGVVFACGPGGVLGHRVTLLPEAP
jgi:hypothetical protein